jgi:hypothetical protein
MDVTSDDVVLLPLPLDAFDSGVGVGGQPPVAGVRTSRLEEAADLGEPAGVAAIEAVVEEVDAHELSAWAQPVVDPFQRCCRSRDVVKGTGRDDDVEASLVGAPGRHVALVVGEPARPVGRAALGELDRGRVGVDGGDVVASPGHLQAERANAAADVEDPRRR